MVSIKVVLAVTVMVVAVAHCYEIEYTRTVEVEENIGDIRIIQGDYRNIEQSIADLTRKFRDAINRLNDQYIETAKECLHNFSEQFKSGLDSFTEMIEEKVDVSDLLKQATRKWKAALEAINENLLNDVTLRNINEKFEHCRRQIIEKADELIRKAKGANKEFEKEIRNFSERQLQNLVDNIKLLQYKIAGSHIQ